MPRRRLRRGLVLCCALGALFASASDAALVRVNGLILHADGGFHPQQLPRQRFAPINFQGYVDIAAEGGGQPPALEQAVVDFDRDGRLSAGGLPVCPPQAVANASSVEARRTCHGAIVGTGRIEALIALPGGNVRGSSALTIFNGPPEAGHRTVVLHARATVPTIETFAIVVPIERRPGGFRYRAILNVPKIAGGLGAITHIDVRVGRRFSVGGQQRSYVSAHCSDGILHTRGRFTFSDGTLIEGSVEKACNAK